MTLGELIAFLEQYPAEAVVEHGFAHPHSYRGYDDELAFEPCGETTVGTMLAAARSALGSTYTGYKAGEYTMGEYTDVHLAGYCNVGDAISLPMLQHMVECHGGVEHAMREQLDRERRHHATLRAAAEAVAQTWMRMETVVWVKYPEFDKLIHRLYAALGEGRENGPSDRL